MTTEEAKGLFALMGWQWEPLSLALGNRERGKMAKEYHDNYEVFVNEVMVAFHREGKHPLPMEYERCDIDRCLTYYATLYAKFISGEGP